MSQVRRTEVHPLLGRRLHSSESKDIVFQVQIDQDRLPFLQDHRVFGAVIFPLAAYIEIALAGAIDVLGAGICVLENLVVGESLVLSDGQPRTLQSIFCLGETALLIYKL